MRLKQQQMETGSIRMGKTVLMVSKCQQNQERSIDPRAAQSIHTPSPPASNEAICEGNPALTQLPSSPFSMGNPYQTADTLRSSVLKLLCVHMILNFPPPEVGICHSNPCHPTSRHHVKSCDMQRLVCPDVYEFEDTVTHHFSFNVFFSGCDTDAIVKFPGTARASTDTLTGL
ncbi:hypothetical protein KOW79_007106 [Hemibagrus wyckioides]|uniref:Uncharacterized protein n=1 Tax=Hemibagrus wyckioides TaxID=337641 RepID=A0A9D3NV20_9TELE|nr:hypothetical protein KOW79_007106 [Hemibagrus wyckioides]